MAEICIYSSSYIWNKSHKQQKTCKHNCFCLEISEQHCSTANGSKVQ